MHDCTSINPSCISGILLPLTSVDLTLSILRVPKIKIQEKSEISSCKILKNEWYHAKVLLKRFDLNGHTIGFRPPIQKLELHYKKSCL